MIDAAEQYHANQTTPSLCRVILKGQTQNPTFLGFLRLSNLPLAPGWILQLTGPGQTAPRSYRVERVQVQAALTQDPQSTEDSECAVEILVQEAA